jgi:hypothetical protein
MKTCVDVRIELFRRGIKFKEILIMNENVIHGCLGNSIVAITE